MSTHDLLVLFDAVFIYTSFPNDRILFLRLVYQTMQEICGQLFLAGNSLYQNAERFEKDDIEKDRKSVI